MNRDCVLLGVFTLAALSSCSSMLPSQEVKAPLPAIEKGKAGPAQPGNSWFPVTESDLGTHFGHEEAVGHFPFRNPTDGTVEWKNLTGSCTCSKAVIRVGQRRYELTAKPTPNQLMRITKGPGGQDVPERVTQITIDPGEEGEVEVHMEMNGVSGTRTATLDIHNSDPKLPQIKLRWHATGAQMFVISPAEVNLNKMTWNETRDFSVTVTSPLKKDFNITRMDDAGKNFQVTWEKAMNGDAASWTVKGKYGPADGDTAGGGVLKFFTDVQGESSFLVRVMAFVQGPLEVKPGGFLTLGMIRKGSSLKRDVVFEPNDGTKLEATALRFEKLTVKEEFVTVTQAKDGDKLVISLQISESAPAGLLKGDLVVELNHPLVKEKRIMFNGFVR
jgi:hypothetical protein